MKAFTCVVVVSVLCNVFAQPPPHGGPGQDPYQGGHGQNQGVGPGPDPYQGGQGGPGQDPYQGGPGQGTGPGPYPDVPVHGSKGNWGGKYVGSNDVEKDNGRIRGGYDGQGFNGGKVGPVPDSYHHRDGGDGGYKGGYQGSNGGVHKGGIIGQSGAAFRESSIPYGEETLALSSAAIEVQLIPILYVSSLILLYI